MTNAEAYSLRLRLAQSVAGVGTAREQGGTMKRIITSLVGTAVVVFGVMVLLSPRADAQCLGDCNGDGKVTSGELTKITAVTINCLPASATGCAAVLGGCPAADKNGNGLISAGELTNIISNILNFVPGGCPPGGSPTATKTAAQPTNTATPAATNTSQPSATATRTASPTPTHVEAAVCGDGAKTGSEECDDGGTCIGGPNAGTPCTSEAQCQGNGICESGIHLGTACGTNADCASGTCVRCKPFGGDGCAANCTTEADIPFTLVPGVARICKNGTKNGQSCTATADCPASPAPAPTPFCLTYAECVAGATANAGLPCGTAADCGGSKCQPQTLPGTTQAFVHDGILQLPLPLNGHQVVTAGHPRTDGADGGKVPFIVKASSVAIDAIKVGALACACTRGIPPKTCGGTLFDADGTTFTTNCTPIYTAGDSLCAGKNPCTFVNGPGNSAAGLIGCQGLDGVNLSFTQGSSQTPHPPPAPPTPPPGSTLPVITLSGSGPPGSVIVINSSAIGTTTALHKPGDVCTGIFAAPATDCTGQDFGKDCKFCTDDDPQSTRGTAAPLPQVSGTASGQIFNTAAYPGSQPDHTIGPFVVTGVPVDCSKLTNQLSLSGETIVGAFTALNQPATGDIVVTNVFIAK